MASNSNGNSRKANRNGRRSQKQGEKHDGPALSCLAPFDRDKKTVNVIIETPKGSRNKFKYDEECGVFSLGSVLPAGSAFPYDFGYIPGTTSGDGDPLDVLLLMDVQGFPGCRVESRLIGVIEAQQTEEDKTERNDRLVAVAVEAHDYRNLKSLKDVEPHLLKEIEHFFVSYNEIRGKTFELLDHRGPARARRVLKEAVRRRKKTSR